MLTITVIAILLTPVAIAAALMWDVFARQVNDRRLKEAREKAKLEVDRLRAERLARDLQVVENRAQLVGNQSVMVELRIEEKRRELHLDRPAGDAPSW